MRGILRPCRYRLGPDLHARWLAHLCGLCLTLRDTAGHPARVLTGYDVLLVPVLIEAQAGRLPTSRAGPCPLRGFRGATVVDSAAPAMQAGAAVALLAGASGLQDKVDDADAPAWLRPLASRTAHRLTSQGSYAAAGCGLDGTDLVAAPGRAAAVEGRADAGLDELLEPAGTAVASVLAHTAGAAGVPGNSPALRQAGDAFGRLVHLVDATQDRAADRRHRRFNALEATGTSDANAGELARSLHADVLRSFDQLQVVDAALAAALLGPTLAAAISRVWPPTPAVRTTDTRDGARAALGLAAAMVAQPAVWRGPARRRQWGEDPYDSYGDRYNYSRRRSCGGPSCGQLLACNCCANCLCNECCGGDSCCCCTY